NRPIPTHPEVWPGPRADNAARDLLAGALAAGADRFVVLDLTGSAGDAERWADLGRRLQDLLGLTPVLVGSAAADAAVAQAVAEALGGTAVNTVGKASTDALLGILRRADLHIGSADALEHLAAASGVPVVMIGDGAAVPPWGVAAAIVTPEGQGGFRPTVVMEAARHVLHAARRL
ncbi:MAG TPA: glycosyltransferase family 9 protein, partial [Azospirillaceae bacterium]|nr:glycosyltransferase family 9 protein [Azospirillaceae bacterium]